MRLEGVLMNMKFETVEKAIQWLNTQVKISKESRTRKNIDKIEAAMAFFNNPHKNLPVIHITGTNGKGSTASFLKQLLLSQGLKVGTFTSPHIMRFNERMTFNGEDIQDDELVYLTEQMVLLNQHMETTEYGRLNYFELYTVMVAIYFEMKQPDVCIVEVGVGGENDCTNVFDGQIAIFTTIGLDHQDRLGNTIEEVAQEKSGIIKQNAIVISGPISSWPLERIRDKADQTDSRHYQFGVDYGFEQPRFMEDKTTQFNFWMKPEEPEVLSHWTISMLGKHQVDNSVIALKAFVEWMKQIKKPIAYESASNALAETYWMARMEKISDNPLAYIDGAHNMAGLRALKQVIQDYYPEKHITILFSSISTKNQEEILPFLLSFNNVKLVISEFEHIHAMSTDKFKEVIAELGLNQENIQLAKNWKDFISQYSSQDNANNLLLITGSLYFASAVREYFKEKVIL